MEQHEVEFRVQGSIQVCLKSQSSLKKPHHTNMWYSLRSVTKTLGDREQELPFEIRQDTRGRLLSIFSCGSCPISNNLGGQYLLSDNQPISLFQDLCFCTNRALQEHPETHYNCSSKSCWFRTLWDCTFISKRPRSWSVQETQTSLNGIQH